MWYTMFSTRTNPGDKVLPTVAMPKDVVDEGVPQKNDGKAVTDPGAMVEFNLDGVRYCVETDRGGAVRPFLVGHDGDDHHHPKLGPVVGQVTDATNLTTVLDTLDLDPIGYAGEYAMEVLHATPVCKHRQAVKPQPIAAVPLDRLKKDLATKGLTVWEQAVSEEQVTAWRNDILSSQTFQDNGQDLSIRSDVVRFVRQSSHVNSHNNNDDRSTKAARQALDVLEYVVAQVVGDTYGDLSVWRPRQGMLAHYLAERRAHYTWHYDNEKQSTNNHQQCWLNFRILTAIIYLNSADWQLDRDGGGLQCEMQHHTTAADSNDHEPKSNTTTRPNSSTVTIAPQGGTVVVFDSRTIRHRVLPALRNRLAVTQWFVAPDLPNSPVGWRLEQQQSSKRPRTQHTDNNSSSFCRVYAPDDKLPTQANLIPTTDNGAAQNDKQQVFSFGFFP